MALSEKGYEIPDPRPMVLHTGVGRELSMDERIRRMIAEQSSMIADQRGMETLEESDDFDVEDSFEDDDYISPYENRFKEEFLNRASLEAEQLSHQDEGEDQEKNIGSVRGTKPENNITDEKLQKRLQNIEDALKNSPLQTRDEVAK